MYTEIATVDAGGRRLQLGYNFVETIEVVTIRAHEEPFKVSCPGDPEARPPHATHPHLPPNYPYLGSPHSLPFPYILFV